MAKIPQLAFFSWEQVEPLGDLERLQLVFDALPDESLMQRLERDRGKGRNDYPIRAMWNSLLAGIVFQHPTIETLRRELLRNGQLRHLCGFRPAVVPPPSVYTRFLQRLLPYEAQLDQMFDALVEALRQSLPSFAEQLAMDGKAIPSFAPHANKNTTPDGRRDLDADDGIKRYHGQHPDGNPGKNSSGGLDIKFTSWSTRSMNSRLRGPSPQRLWPTSRRPPPCSTNWPNATP